VALSELGQSCRADRRSFFAIKSDLVRSSTASRGIGPQVGSMSTRSGRIMRAVDARAACLPIPEVGSVLSRSPPSVIDDEHLHRGFSRFQSQSELLLNCREEAWAGPIPVLRRPFQVDVERADEVSAIHNF